MIEISLSLAIILLIIFFVIGFVIGFILGRDSGKRIKRDGVMVIDESMGIASIGWEVPYEDVVQADTIRLDVVHKDA